MKKKVVIILACLLFSFIILFLILSNVNNFILNYNASSEKLSSITGEVVSEKAQGSNLHKDVETILLKEYKPKKVNQEEIFLDKKFNDNGRYIVSSIKTYSPEWYPDGHPKQDLKKLTVELQVIDKTTWKNFSIKGTADIPKYYSGSFDFNTSSDKFAVFKDINPNFTWEYSEDYSFVSTEKQEGIVIGDEEDKGPGSKKGKIKARTFVEEKEFKNYKALDATTKVNIPKGLFLDPDITGCGTLGTAGATYTLTQNVTPSSETCFYINAANVTLNCTNYWVTYGTSASNGDYGIHVDVVNNVTIKNCNILDGNFAADNSYFRPGIVLESNYSTVLRNYAKANHSSGFFVSDTFHANFTNNTFYSVSSSGMYVEYSVNNTILNINSTGPLHRGFDSDTITSNRLINNTFSGGDKGYIISSSNYNNLTNNTAISTGGPTIPYGPNAILFWSGSEYNSIINDTALCNGVGSGGYAGPGISFYKSNNNIASGVNATSLLSDGDGISVYLSNNTLIRDCKVLASAEYDIDVSGANTNLTIINCSYTNAKENLASTAQLTRKWYYKAYVNYSNGTYASGANVSAYNVSNIIQFTENTNASGWIQRKEVIEYNNTGGTRSYYNNYSINASLAGFTTDVNVWNFTIQTNKIDDFFTLLTSTCAYSSGNWNINCSENCSIVTNFDVGGNNISIIGVGTVTVSANISNYMNLHINGESSVNICRVRCINGGCFKN